MARADGPLWQAILDVAEQRDAAVIVLGSRGLSGIKSFVLGSVSSAVVHHATRPTLVVRHGVAGHGRRRSHRGQTSRVTIDVLQCIGCGAIATPQPCLGTCVDRRLDLVAADQHALAESAVEAMETTRTLRRALLGEVARSPLAPADWELNERAPESRCVRLPRPRRRP